MAHFDAANLQVDLQDDGTAVLWLDVPDRPHNVFNPQVLSDLERAVDWIAEGGVSSPSTHHPPRATQLVIVTSRKPTGFAAGADLNEFKTIRGPEEAMALAEQGQRVFGKLADLSVPSIALVHGLCLGGGLECALACDYRVIVDQPGTLLAFPEIDLGLLPGWGGTQRLPRVVGIEPALRMILQRRRQGITVKEAQEWGLADAVAASQEKALTELSAGLGERFRRRGKRPMARLPLRTWRQRLLESTGLGRRLLFRGAAKILRHKTPEDMPAPAEALKAVRVGLRRDMTAGLAFERQAIGRLATTTACRNLMTIYFLIENARKQREADAGSDANGAQARIRRVGIVGAGTMGAGIAQLAAIKDFEVVIQEVNETALKAGIQKVEGLFQKAVERRLLSSEEAQRKLAAIGKTTTWEGFDRLDLVVEAVLEDLELKRQVFRELERRTAPATLLATNTSSLLVGQLQEGLDHPERVAGLHFFNPVHKMPLVEVVRAPATKDSMPGVLAGWAAGLGKTPVVVKDSPGFVVNRILMPYVNEAVLLAAEGMTFERIDRVMCHFGMPMGPFELLDQVGLDVAAHIGKTMEPHFGNRFIPNPTFARMCQKGWLGQKNSTGFYRYQGKKRVVNDEARSCLPEGVATAAVSPDADESATREARERMVLLMVNEAAACLGEGVSDRAEEIDLAMVLGTGWAPHRGGPLRYTDDRGVADVVNMLDNLARRLGSRFEPSSELRRRAAPGGEALYNLLTATAGV
jgi:3-hydroxyacyl-CoA dehydrogenase/enoyl-CoA hydratase/3-hydroxybutyryl-CoA epimerase